MSNEFLSLPWQIQLALASGYAAYLVAYAGQRDHHGAVEITFRSLGFGLVATAIAAAMAGSPRWLILLTASIGAIISGGLWRRFGIPIFRWLMKKTDISWSDDVPTAWQTLTVCNSRYPLSQISIELTDGSWLRCIDTRRFAESPFGPAVIGKDGDIALYVTNSTTSDGEDFDAEEIEVDYFGSRITYIPASSIRRVDLRHSSPIPSSGERAQALQGEGAP
ncbi:hypothetical protein [Aurantiacibacter zhengii]|uniref:hypothetical protein n=1 Tax=Aurantiacibacter zhengii TaxID=2307003 RepID=UPI0011C20FA3|nr:hypothetical protein [Aurantiacibacter zhengii]